MADDPGGPDRSGEQRPSDGNGGASRGERWRASALGRGWRQAAEIDLMRRSMGFAAQGLVTLAPLLIVVAAIDPFHENGFAQWVTDGMSLPPRDAAPVYRLFATERAAAQAAGAVSLALLAVFGLSFVVDVQSAYEKIWRLPAPSWHALWRQAVWLGALTAYVGLTVESGVLFGAGFWESAGRIALLGAFSLVFFWWGQHFLLGGRVSWRALLPGAVATIVGLGGLRVFSWLVFDPMVVSNAEAYGAVGIVVVVESWLIGVGFVFFGGALAGRLLVESRRRKAEESHAG
jgi:membrane protein